MTDTNTLIHTLLCDINNNEENSIYEIKVHTLTFLNQYRNDNLTELIKKATQRGYSGIEWIDFWGVGGINYELTIQWAYEIIMEQKLNMIIEPYYNNVNHRLGISIKRYYVKGKLRFLPIELYDKIIKGTAKKTIELSKNIIPINDSLEKKNENSEYFVVKNNSDIEND